MISNKSKHLIQMKNISTGFLILFSILLVNTNANSQAIKVDFLGYSGITERYSNPMYWGIGYDHNLIDKLSVGLTYKKGYSFDDSYYINQVDYGFPTSDGDVLFSIYHKTNWHEFAFTSKYFFEDNSDGSYFVSSGISLFQATNTYDLNNLSVNGDPGPAFYGDLREGIYEQDITLIPFSLDLGRRGEFDGFYFEYNLGVGFTPFGAHPDVEPASLANHGVETRFAPISFHFGLSFGFSWAD